ncbi:Purple acid phosphatase [Minicystis rosea]|nr:Purple acid phosphatase [Minicystis rosea]
MASPRPGSASPPNGVAAIAKGPYLQGLAPTSVTVKVEVSAPAPARIEVRPAGKTEPVVTAAGDGPRPFHALRVEGLAPATAYDYVLSVGATIQERGRFTTAPVDARPFRFLVYGDNRTDEAAHAAVVRAMAAVPADFLINTGDMVARGNEPDDWQTFFGVEGALLRNVCLFAAVGNHELYRGSREGEVAFLKYFGGVDGARAPERLYGTFRWSNTRFFVLNAMDNWTGAERDWLRAELDRALTEPGLAHRIAVMHWGPFSAGPHRNNPALESGGVIAMMRERKVDLVLAGHDHIYERGTGAGLKYIVSGGGGAPLYTKKADVRETAAFEPSYHFVEAVVDGEQVRITARRASGGVIEACSFTGAGAWSCP